MANKLTEKHNTFLPLCSSQSTNGSTDSSPMECYDLSQQNNIAKFYPVLRLPQKQALPMVVVWQVHSVWCEIFAQHPQQLLWVGPNYSWSSLVKFYCRLEMSCCSSETAKKHCEVWKRPSKSLSYGCLMLSYRVSKTLLQSCVSD